jgi:hypothetical protein
VGSGKEGVEEGLGKGFVEGFAAVELPLLVLLALGMLPGPEGLVGGFCCAGSAGVSSKLAEKSSKLGSAKVAEGTEEAGTAGGVMSSKLKAASPSAGAAAPSTLVGAEGAAGDFTATLEGGG